MNKLLNKLGLTISIIWAANGLISCQSEQIPDNSPCLVNLSNGTCVKFDLIDKVSLTYAADKNNPHPLSYIDEGYCFPKGQLPEMLVYLREQKKQCESIQSKYEIESNSAVLP